MSDGYVYCFSNESMPGILKIGMTERTPDARLAEANSSDTWRPPTPYKIEFAKKVIHPKEKETILHTLLSKYTDRINPKREFFRVSSHEVKIFFDLMDGKWWNNIVKNKNIEDIDDEDLTVAQLIAKRKNIEEEIDEEHIPISQLISKKTEPQKISKYFDQFKCPSV